MYYGQSREHEEKGIRSVVNCEEIEGCVLLACISKQTLCTMFFLAIGFCQIGVFRAPAIALMTANKVFRPLLNISTEFSAEEFETALFAPNDTLSDIHMPSLKVESGGY